MELCTANPIPPRPNPVQKFLLTQDNAEKAEHNNELLKGRKRVLEQTMTFRRPQGSLIKTFKRGFHATYGKLEKVDRIQGSTIHVVGGDKVDIKRVMPVNRDSTEVLATFGSFSQKAENRRIKTRDLIDSLRTFLGDEEKSMAKSVEFLKERWGEEPYAAILKSVGAHNLADVIRLFDDIALSKRGNYVSMKT